MESLRKSCAAVESSVAGRCADTAAVVAALAEHHALATTEARDKLSQQAQQAHDAMQVM